MERRKMVQLPGLEYGPHLSISRTFTPSAILTGFIDIRPSANQDHIRLIAEAQMAQKSVAIQWLLRGFQFVPQSLKWRSCFFSS